MKISIGPKQFRNPDPGTYIATFDAARPWITRQRELLMWRFTIISDAQTGSEALAGVTAVGFSSFRPDSGSTCQRFTEGLLGRQLDGDEVDLDALVGQVVLIHVKQFGTGGCWVTAITSPPVATEGEPR